jgi:hypothetical protein
LSDPPDDVAGPEILGALHPSVAEIFHALAEADPLRELSDEKLAQLARVAVRACRDVGENGLLRQHAIDVIESIA